MNRPERDPVEDWFSRAGCPTPAAQHEVRAALPGGVLALRTHSAECRAYLAERCRLLRPRSDRPTDVVAEVFCLQGPSLPAVVPAAPAAVLRGKKSSGVFHSYGAGDWLCVWRPPALMGCAFSGDRPGIRLVATPVDPRLCRRPPGGYRIKSSGGEIDYPAVWDLALCLFARLRGLSLFHGAVLGRGTGGVLLTGETGCGKTTAALSLVRGGYRLLTDEYAVLWRNGPWRGRFGGVLVPPMVVGPPPGSLAALEETMGGIAKSKSPFFVRRAWTRRAPVALRAILMLARPERRTAGHRAVPLDPLESLATLMAQLLDPVQGRREDILATLLEVVERVPAFRVEAGTDLASLPAFVQALMARRSPAGRGP